MKEEIMLIYDAVQRNDLGPSVTVTLVLPNPSKF